MLESKESIEQFLTLASKNETQLKEICSILNVQEENSKQNLIEKISNFETKETLRLPFILPMRSKNEKGVATESSIKTFKNIRAALFNKGVNRKFTLLTSQNKPYTLDLKSLECSTSTLQSIFDQGLILPTTSNLEIIEEVKKDSNKFVAHFVQKPDKAGNSWVMLHLDRRLP